MGQEVGRARRQRAALQGWVLGGVIAAVGAGCGGPAVEISEAVRVREVTTGWFDAGLVAGGRNRLVPTISFRLENTTDTPIRTVQVNSVFRRPVDEAECPECEGWEEWGNAFVRAIDRDGLAPGASTPPLVLRSDLGYTGEQPRLEMFEHRDFRDVKVELFVKHGGAQWVKLEEFPIHRQLLTQ